MDEAIKNLVYWIIKERDRIFETKIIDPRDDYWIGVRKTYDHVLITLDFELRDQGLSLESFWPPNYQPPNISPQPIRKRDKNG